MSSPSTSFFTRNREILLAALHLFALCSIAIAQPLFETLGDNATFFVANRLGPREIVTFMLVLCVIIPGAMWGVVLIVRIFSRRGAGLLQSVFVSGLFLLIFLPFLKKVSVLNGVAQVSVSTILALLGAVLYHRRATAKMFVSALSPAIVVVPALFAFFTPVAKILMPPGVKSIEGRNIQANVPIVMVVFDEFSVVSLMDGERNIDSVRYPNFYALSRTATWYRNATTVCDVTERVVPSILTGQFPDVSPRTAPSRGNYPENLLTLLHDAYDIRSMESVTDLCADPESESILPVAMLKRDFAGLRADMKSIFLNVVLPKDLQKGGPSLTKSWGGFAWMDSTKKTFTKDELWQLPNQFRREKFRIFIDSVKRTARPSFHFLHTLFPHVPYEYIPSGKRYLSNPYDGPEYHLVDEYWGDLDPEVILESYQRYLLQVGFMDRLIGELIERMKSEQMYEETLLIITADHGVSFQRMDYRRPLTEKNYMDILPVPLFIKYPHQSSGSISDVNAELIDILPTIAEVLKIEVPWQMDGISLLDTAITHRSKKRAVNIHRQDVEHEVHEYPPVISEIDQTLKQQLRDFGAGTSGGDLYRIGRFRHLLGKPLRNFTTTWSRKFLPVIDHRKYYETLALADDPLVTEITGNVKFLGSDLPTTVAIVVNDTVRAVRTVTDTAGGSFEGLIPDYSLHEANNRLEITLVRIPKSESPVFLRPLLDGEYSLTYSNWGEEVLKNPRGEAIPLNPVSKGYLDTVVASETGLLGAGWSADLATREIPTLYVVFINNEFHYAGTPGDNDRPDLAALFKHEKFRNAGYSFNFIAQNVREMKDPKIRVFGIFEKYASELNNRTWTQSPAHLAGKRLLRLRVEENGRASFEFMNRRKEEPIPLVTGLEGTVDDIRIQNNVMTVAGWAADIRNGEPAGRIVMTVNDTSLAIFTLDIDRPDLVKAFKKQGVLKSGFFATLGKESTGDLFKSDRIRLFAISKDGRVASELSYPPKYPLKH